MLINHLLCFFNLGDGIKFIAIKCTKNILRRWKTLKRLLHQERICILNDSANCVDNTWKSLGKGK
jgi:hypothetical protein